MIEAGDGRLRISAAAYKGARPNLDTTYLFIHQQVVMNKCRGRR